MEIAANESLMSVKEVAAMLNVKPSWVYGKVATKEIPHVHAGRYPRFVRSEILAWIRGEHVAS